MTKVHFERAGAKRTRSMRFFLLAVLLMVASVAAVAEVGIRYPVDGYEKTGIRRLARLQLILDGEMRGTRPVAGALKSWESIRLHLPGPRGDDLEVLPSPDPELQNRINTIFPQRDASYAIAVLDITPGREPRLAVRGQTRSYSPGSVGKLLIAAGLFAEMQKLFPTEPGRRAALLRDRMVVADRWIHSDEHEIPIFDPATGAFSSRPAREGDTFSLYEWTDHMLSASANSAASVVWKECVLMRAFGSAYPPSLAEERAYFERTPRAELTRIAMDIVNGPIQAAGISREEWRLGSFFTRAGKTIIPGEGGSSATAIGYLKFLVAIERGKIVDPWASLEIKRLMYMTARRIRYASSPALSEAAVYFKSGSMYRCKQEPEFKCGKYMGNVDNIMNSVAIVEQDDGRVYLVGLMSNVLRKNSAVEHQSIATFVERIMAAHPGPNSSGGPNRPK